MPRTLFETFFILKANQTSNIKLKQKKGGLNNEDGKDTSYLQCTEL